MGQASYLEWMLETRHEIKNIIFLCGALLLLNILGFCVGTVMPNWYYILCAITIVFLTIILVVNCNDYRELDKDIKNMERRFNLFM